MVHREQSESFLTIGGDVDIVDGESGGELEILGRWVDFGIIIGNAIVERSEFPSLLVYLGCPLG